jgi:hypothetical protein
MVEAATAAASSIVQWLVASLDAQLSGVRFPVGDVLVSYSSLTKETEQRTASVFVRQAGSIAQW